MTTEKEARDLRPDDGGITGSSSQAHKAAVRTCLDVSVVQTPRIAASFIVTRPAQKVLHRLAEQTSHLIARPIDPLGPDPERRDNALKPTRPVTLSDPENGWHKIILPHEMARRGRLATLRELRPVQPVWATRRDHVKTIINDDHAVGNCPQNVIHGCSGWGDRFAHDSDKEVSMI